jgi:hypothetical protein
MHFPQHVLTQYSLLVLSLYFLFFLHFVHTTIDVQIDQNQNNNLTRIKYPPFFYRGGTPLLWYERYSLNVLKLDNQNGKC